MTTSGDAVVDYTIDGDDQDDDQPTRDFMTARMGGTVYRVYRPKLMSWLQMLKHRRGPDADMIAALLGFFETCFTEDDREDLERRFRNPLDSLDAPVILRVLDACMESWTPELTEQAQAMGVKVPTADKAPANGPRASTRRR